ncbi:hypothetical protein ABMA46_10180 [Mesorhizobium sp. CN5-321]|uniref:hypothetical protein n=1 Tax=Mesorhizobium hunchu TaxID=3157708 RepID=UPI0032B72825
MKPPLTNREVYDLLHQALLLFRRKRADSDEGQGAIDAAHAKLEALQRGLLTVEDYRERTGDRD